MPVPVLDISFYLLLTAVCSDPILERRKMRTEMEGDLPEFIAVGGGATAHTPA